MVMTASIFVAFLKMGASVAVLFLVSIEAFCPKPVFVRMAGHCVHSGGLFRSGEWVSRPNANVNVDMDENKTTIGRDGFSE